MIRSGSWSSFLLEHDLLPKTGSHFSGSCSRNPAMTNPFADPLAWRPIKAPSLDELHVMAEEAYRRLPGQVWAARAEVGHHFGGFSSAEVLEKLKAETEFDLLALFQGIGLPFQSESAPVHMPNMIWLYRVPILLYWAEHDETIGAIVTHVL